MRRLTTHASSASRPAARRGGFTLIELLIVMVLLSLVMGMLLSVLNRQQRFYRGASDLMETRSQMRQTIGVLPMELRSISPTTVRTDAATPSDLLYIADTVVRMRANIGSSVVCEISGSGTTSATISLPPEDLASGNQLTSFGLAPAAGDSIAIFDDGASSGGSDDGWVWGRITSTPTKSTTACPVTANLTSALDAGKERLVLSVSLPATNSISVGNPIRFLRKVAFSFYQATDGDWYLGYREADATGTYSAVQPVAGPYPPFSTDTTQTGLIFRYYNASGNQLVPNAGGTVAQRQAVTRVRVYVRGNTTSSVKSAGGAESTSRDFQDLSIALRNNN